MSLFGREVCFNASHKLSPMSTSTGRWLDCTTRGNSLFIQNNYYGGCGCGCGGGIFGYGYGGFGWNNFGFGNFGFGCGCGCGCGSVGNWFMGGLGMGIANGLMGLLGTGLNWLGGCCGFGGGMFGMGADMFGMGGGYMRPLAEPYIRKHVTPEVKPTIEDNLEDKDKKDDEVKPETKVVNNADYEPIVALQERINALDEESSNADIKALLDDIWTRVSTPDSDGIQADIDKRAAENLYCSCISVLVGLGKTLDDNGNVIDDTEADETGDTSKNQKDSIGTEIPSTSTASATVSGNQEGDVGTEDAAIAAALANANPIAQVPEEVEKSDSEKALEQCYMAYNPNSQDKDIRGTIDTNDVIYTSNDDGTVTVNSYTIQCDAIFGLKYNVKNNGDGTYHITVAEGQTHAKQLYYIDGGADYKLEDGKLVRTGKPLVSTRNGEGYTALDVAA